MRFMILFPLALVALLPFCEAIFLFETAAAGTATGLSLGLGTGGAVAAAGAVSVAGALLVGGLIVAAVAANRGKRDVSSQCLPMNNPDLFITLAASADSLGCGMRLVCELEATPDELLNQDEKIILGLFGRQVKPATFSELKSAKAGFQYAAFVGANAKNISECASVFDQCPFDRSTMMQSFNAAK